MMAFLLRFRKLFRLLAILAVVIGLPGDFINLVRGVTTPWLGHGEGPQMIEDYSPTSLDKCFYTATVTEFAEPAPQYNMLDWLFGLSAAEDDAYRRALQRARQSEPELATLESQSAWAQTVEQRPPTAGRWQVIRRQFYFDRWRYHASLTFGRLRTDLQGAYTSNCEIDLARGSVSIESRTLPFSCSNLSQLLSEQLNRLNTVPDAGACWTKLTYQANPSTGLVTFQTSHFTWDDIGRSTE